MADIAELMRQWGFGDQNQQVGANAVLAPNSVNDGDMGWQEKYFKSMAEKNNLKRSDLSFSENMFGTEDFEGRLGQGLGAAQAAYGIYSGIQGAKTAKDQFDQRMAFMDRDYRMRKDAYDTAQTQRTQRVNSARGGAAWDSNALSV